MSALYQQFETNKNLEVNGIEVSFGPNSKGNEIRFRVARAGGANAKKFKEAFEKHSRPHRHLMNAKNNKLSEETAAKITRLTFLDSILLGWTNVEDRDGKPLEYNRENADKLFSDLPGLLFELEAHSRNDELFLEHLRELDEGN